MVHPSGDAPKTIMLAAGLNGRGDRALDRATDLAIRWDADLLVVHALEDAGSFGAGRPAPSWRRPPDVAERVERAVRRDVRGPCPRLRFHIEEGPALKVILEAAHRERPALLVVAMGRDGLFGQMSRTVDELFRQSPVSLLVVKQRSGGPYRHVLVGADYSEEARVALEASTRLFPDAATIVMHAYDMPYQNLYLDPSLAERFGSVEQQTMAAWLAGADLPAGDRPVTLIEHGPPEAMLAAYVRERNADLTVIGAYGRSRIFHSVVGGAGPRILQAVDSDVFVVRPPPPA